MDRVSRQIRGTVSRFQTREDFGKIYISGYFSVFNSDYEIWPGATESIAPGAFDETISGDIRCLIDHETRLVLGRTKSGTLTLKTDSCGLWGEVEVNQSDQDAMNLYARVQREDVNQCSFGFDIVEEEFEERDGIVHWTIKKVKLYEVSVVTFPAYDETSVSARKRQLTDIRKRELDAMKRRILKKVRGEK